MDDNVCNVIYVDRNVREDRLLRPSSTEPDVVGSQGVALDDEPQILGDNLQLLLGAFGDIYVCATGTSCITKLFDLHDTPTIASKPTIVLIDTPHDEPLPEHTERSRSPSPHSNRSHPDGDADLVSEEELYGLRLLQRVATEVQLRKLSKLVVPIPLFSDQARNAPISDDVVGLDTPAFSTNGRAAHPRLLKKCLEFGASDVMASPLHLKNIASLEVHAYRAHKDAVKERQAMLEVRKGRKRSWVGVNGEKPFAYLREAMVSGLMSGICSMNGSEPPIVGGVSFSITHERQSQIAEAVGKWHFCAHDLSDDELIIAASIMFNHTLSMPELEQWRIPQDQLFRYLIACRAAYNSFVPYHNFRHVVDVLQATFSFLVNLGALSPFPQAQASDNAQAAKSPVAALLHPFEALTLLITAIGHDVGHPGVNNGFLVTLNAPLAQLYNDRSVLEAFHCAAYSQILRRHWPQAFDDKKMRNLMISSILATDMGLHFEYMKKMGDLQEKLLMNNTTSGWNGRVLEEQKALTCALLIKCADISNVARAHDTALQWMSILSDEFARQASMESELEIPTALMAPPLKDSTSMFRAQINFMSLFAIPLFSGVVEILPELQYCVDELENNRGLFTKKVAAASSPERKATQDGTLSPKSASSVTTELSKEQPIAQIAPKSEASESTEQATLKEFTPPPAEPTSKPAHVPDMATEYKEVNGGVSTTFDAVRDFAASDPFNINEVERCGPTRQRCSETTEGSAAGTGDWASQATSATTGKMPLSPSTQGTSVVSRDSMDRPGSRPVTTITAPDSAKSMTELKVESQPIPEDDTSNSSRITEEKSLKKRPSRFRMNALSFFRKHKSPSPAAEAP